MRKLALLAAALALGATFSESASAGGRVAVGISFGFPLYYPAPVYYAPPPPYYYYAPRVVHSSPPMYVERQEAAGERSVDSWYYCEQSKTYYPYVKTCPGGWQKVPPTPRG
jgi:hypothetical protein